MNPSSSIKKDLSKLLENDNSKKKFLFKNDSDDIFNYLSNDYSSNNSINNSILNNNRLKKNKMFFKFNIDSLSNDIDKFNSYKNIKINICCFSVNTKCLKPFLLYLLINNSNLDNLFTFPFFYSKEKKNNLSLLNKNLNLIFGKIIDFKGFIFYNNELFTFFSLPNNFSTIKNLKKDDLYWFVLIDEIINKNTVLNFKINKNITEFFLNNEDFIYLFDNKDNKYETPTSLYYGENASKINFIARFGIMKSSPFASMGPFYYFATYNLALRFSSWSNNFKELYLDDILLTDNKFGRYKNGGIVRFAVFLGDTKVFFQKENLMNNNENDRNSDWTKNYDSTMVGQIEEKKNSFNHIGSQFCVKKYYQQIPLSYHFINKATVPENYISNNNIQIQ